MGMGQQSSMKQQSGGGGQQGSAQLMSLLQMFGQNTGANTQTQAMIGGQPQAYGQQQAQPYSAGINNQYGSQTPGMYTGMSQGYQGVGQAYNGQFGPQAPNSSQNNPSNPQLGGGPYMGGYTNF